MQYLGTVQHREIDLKHHPGVRNPDDLFTKEHKEQSHFTSLRECLVASRVGVLSVEDPFMEILRIPAYSLLRSPFPTLTRSLRSS
jgi:hypothetical protein